MKFSRWIQRFLLLAFTCLIVECDFRCGGSYSSGSSSTTRHGATVEIDRIHIEIEKGVSFGHSVEVKGKKDLLGGREEETRSESVQIEGKALSVSDGRLQIGDNNYGEIKPGDRVRISKDGIEVNGEKREPLPK